MHADRNQILESTDDVMKRHGVISMHRDNGCASVFPVFGDGVRDDIGNSRQRRLSRTLNFILESYFLVFSNIARGTCCWVRFMSTPPSLAVHLFLGCLKVRSRDCCCYFSNRSPALLILSFLGCGRNAVLKKKKSWLSYLIGLPKDILKNEWSEISKLRLIFFPSRDGRDSTNKNEKGRTPFIQAVGLQKNIYPAYYWIKNQLAWR